MKLRLLQVLWLCTVAPLLALWGFAYFVALVVAGTVDEVWGQMPDFPRREVR